MLRWTERVIRLDQWLGLAGALPAGGEERSSREPGSPGSIVGAVILGEVDVSVSSVDACEAGLAGSQWSSEMAVVRIRQSILPSCPKWTGGAIKSALPVTLIGMGQGNAIAVRDALLSETWVTPLTDAPFLSNLTGSWLIIRGHLESYVLMASL